MWTARAARFATTAVLLASIAACGQGGDQTVTGPSPTPTAPAPPAPPPPAGSVFGTVFEYSATGNRRAVPNLRLRVRAGSPFDGAVGGVDLPDVVTDASGRYVVAGGASLILFFSTAPGSSHRFLCDFHPLVLIVPVVRDLPVVDVSWSGNELPPGIWWPGTSVHGTVSEVVNGTRRPVEGATVTLDTGNQDPPATTSATGFYMVCSVVGTDQYRTITASKGGYSAVTRQIIGGSDFRVDLELAR